MSVNEMEPTFLSKLMIAMLLLTRNMLNKSNASPSIQMEMPYILCRLDWTSAWITVLEAAASSRARLLNNK